MSDHIILQIDDKAGLLECLQAEESTAQQYADLCLSVLVEDWGADPATIDQVGLLESCLGRQIHCTVHDEPIGSPSEFIERHLQGRSDYGLDKCGLTRAQYNRALQARRQDES